MKRAGNYWKQRRLARQGAEPAPSAAAAPVPAPDEPWLRVKDHTLNDLRQLAKSMGLKGFSRLKKPELLDRIRASLRR